MIKCVLVVLSVFVISSILVIVFFCKDRVKVLVRMIILSFMRVKFIGNSLVWFLVVSKLVSWMRMCGRVVFRILLGLFVGSLSLGKVSVVSVLFFVLSCLVRSRAVRLRISKIFVF